MLTKLCVLSLALLAGAQAQTLTYAPTTATAQYPTTTAAYYPATTAQYAQYPTTAQYAAYPTTTAAYPTTTAAYPTTTAAYAQYPTTTYPTTAAAYYPTTAYPTTAYSYGYAAPVQAPVTTTTSVPQYQQPTASKLTGACQLYDTASSKATNPPVNGVIQYNRQQPYCDTFVANAVSCRVPQATLTQYAQNTCAAGSFSFQ